MTRAEDTSDILENRIQCFRRSDLVAEASSDDGEVCYFAVEVSHTADGQDVARAVSNARLLTRFTGKRAYAAVAGVHKGDRIQDAIESGKVRWHQLDPHEFE